MTRKQTMQALHPNLFDKFAAARVLVRDGVALRDAILRAGLTVREYTLCSVETDTKLLEKVGGLRHERPGIKAIASGIVKDMTR